MPIVNSDRLPHMPHADFVHLRVHSAYSLSEGALKIKDIVAQCTAAQMPAVAITDTANLFGALEFAQACAGSGIQPIIGCQLAVRREQAEGPGEHFAGSNGRNGAASPPPDHLILLAQSVIYSNAV